MNEPMLGQTSRSAVESYLRAKREKGQLTDEEIARLDAIGFKWEKRKKKTIEEKVDLYVHYRESGKRWRCNETGERFRSLDDARVRPFGLHPNGSDPDEILTISIIGRDGSVLLDERFRPTVKTEWPHASAINGIYPEDVADLPTIETAIPRLREIFAGADEVIGYNVGFDLGFLSAVGVRPREDARITDTMNLFTWFMGRRYKLVDAADHIGYEWTGRAHGSLADALATLAVQRWLEQWLVAE